MLTSNAPWLGQGLAFPPRLGEDGRFVVSSGREHIEESLRIILLTEKGERLLLPAFGAGLRRFLFAPNTASTHRLIQDAVSHAIARWEPRVEQVSVLVAKDPEDDASVIIRVKYTIRADQRPGQLSLRVRLSE